MAKKTFMATVCCSLLCLGGHVGYLGLKYTTMTKLKHKINLTLKIKSSNQFTKVWTQVIQMVWLLINSKRISKKVKVHDNSEFQELYLQAKEKRFGGNQKKMKEI